ncbi:MAG: hypothetical protein PWQ55_776 [Chloroflexota bacterium]|nr:hypothetical protein [Chloroflexota bacterium]
MGCILCFKYLELVILMNVCSLDATIAEHSLGERISSRV